VISRERGALTLQTLQTLAEVVTEHSSTLVLPIPLDVLDAERNGDASTSGHQAQAPDDHISAPGSSASAWPVPRAASRGASAWWEAP
jgi:hypothetical protein